MSSGRALLPCALMPLLLVGCGSSSPPPITVSCAVRTLPSGADRVRITVRNTTGSTSKAFIYGPALASVEHVFPPHLLSPTTVTVTSGSRRQTYLAYLIARTSPQHPVHALLRLGPRSSAVAIQASQSRSVQDSSGNSPAGGACHIKGKR